MAGFVIMDGFRNGKESENEVLEQSFLSIYSHMICILGPGAMRN